MLDEVKLDGPRVLLVLSPDTKDPPEEAAALLRDRRAEEQPLHPRPAMVRPRQPRREDPHALRRRQAPGAELPEEPPAAGGARRAVRERPSRISTRRSPPRSTASGTRPRGARRRRSSPCSSPRTISTARSRVEKALADDRREQARARYREGRPRADHAAEDIIWPENQKRVPWRDIKARALVDPAWIWLPNNGLEHAPEDRRAARRLALHRRRLHREGPVREAEDLGASSPSAATTRRPVRPRSRSSPATRARRRRSTGTRSPRSRRKSYRLTDPKLTTDATRLWFLAVDPAGEHERGRQLVGRIA